MFDRKKSPTGLAKIVDDARSGAGSGDRALTRANLTNQTAQLARVVASGHDVHSDAQRLLYFLASYGQGDRTGKYAFSSGELVGLGSTTNIDGDYVHAVEAGAESKGLSGITGPRLNSAATFLESKGWAKLTHDGEYGIGCQFHEVALTDQGRAAAQGAVRRAGLSGNEADLNPFDDLRMAGPASAPAAAEREQFTAMLSRAKIAFSVEHAARQDDGSDAEGTTMVTLENVAFTFDDEGALLGCGAVDDDAKETDE